MVLENVGKYAVHTSSNLYVCPLSYVCDVTADSWRERIDTNVAESKF